MIILLFAVWGTTFQASQCDKSPPISPRELMEECLPRWGTTDSKE